MGGPATSSPEFPARGPRTGALGLRGGSPPPLSFLLGDPERKPVGSGVPYPLPRLGFPLGDPERGAHRAPSQPLCLDFPLGETRTGTWRIWGAPAAPVPVFLLKDPEREPGGFRGAPSPRTNLAGLRTWQARRRGPVLPPLNFFYQGLWTVLPPFYSITPKC